MVFSIDQGAAVMLVISADSDHELLFDLCSTHLETRFDIRFIKITLARFNTVCLISEYVQLVFGVSQGHR